jgi:hypothetical protein
MAFLRRPLGPTKWGRLVVASLNPVHGEVCSMQYYVLVCQCFSPGTRLSSINKTEHNDIIEILLKVALNTINLKPNASNVCSCLLYCG